MSSWATEKFTKTSGHLTLRPLEESDVEAVAFAVQDAQGWAARHWDTGTPEKAAVFLRKLLAARDRGESLPMVYLVHGEIAGISCFHAFAERRKGVEIGFTTVAPKFRRSRVNSEVKKLLLERAFEELGAVRVELRVDARNYNSQMAVLRIGAKFEGKIRRWVVRDDRSSPDGMLYSITDAEWPGVKARLGNFLEGIPPPSPYLTPTLKSARVSLSLSRQSDAQDFLTLAQQDRASIADSFPQLGKITELSEAQAYIAERAHQAAEGTCFHYIARENATGKLVGHVQVKGVSWELRSAELGYLIGEDFRGRGLAHEMLQLVLAELKEKHRFERLTVRILPENKPSRKLAAKLGFQEEGVLRRQHLTSAGERRDVVLSSLIRG